MIPATLSRRLAAAILLVAAIAFASLMPADLQLRSGLNWLTEHFIVYAVASFALTLIWPRPFIVAALLAALSGLLELLQGLTPDRAPDLSTALAGAGGAFAASLTVQFGRELRKRLTGRP